jgi:hypothetical protein
MKTEIGLTTAFVIGLIFKFSHLPGGNMLIVISMGAMAMLYFPLAFYFFSDKNIKTQNLALSIISGLLLSTVPLALLFKLLYWPGATVYSYTSVIGSIISIITVLALRKGSADNLKNYYKNMLTRTSILTAVSLIFLFILTTKTLVFLQYGQDPELARLKYQHFTNPDNQQYADELETYEITKAVEPVTDKNTNP